MHPIPTSTKLDILKWLKKNISLPEKNYFVKNSKSIRLCYFKHTWKGTGIKYITLATEIEVADFLKKHGVIADYDFKDGVLQMFRLKILSSRVNEKDGSFTMLSAPVVYSWDDIEILPGEALHYAAYNEYELAGGKLGIMFTNMFQKKGNRAA